jgi:hypothetical protein
LSAPESSDLRRAARRKNFILLPAVRLMNRLTYPRKFFLISVLFLAALGLVMTFMQIEFRKSIDFTAKEIEGTRYLAPLVDLYRDAGEARRLLKVFARGEKTMRPEVNRKIADIDKDLQAVGEIDRELGVSMESTAKLETLRKNWDYLRKETFNLSAAESDTLLGDLLKEIRGLYSHVGDKSNLILDPDLDTYYLMDAILLKLHQGQDLLMRAAIESEAIAVRTTLTPEERAEFIVLLGAIRLNVQETRDNAERCFNNNPSGTARPKLQKHYDDLYNGTISYVDNLKRDLVDAKALTVSPQLVAKANLRIQEMSFDLWGRARTELDDLMKVRVGGYEQRLQIAWVCTAVALSLVGYLWVAFYAGVMGTETRRARV